ncbi:hypothetical protein M9H77_19943 [Catharanthus roseus]|uniref:Uncharacterized protein n=1 Tax=Catharanthus roseus TaxID=4058 RepID=A0ACC0AK27_CATRO|nr:hypothetical protein M9H77_19943 [Catharanthus roseus]
MLRTKGSLYTSFVLLSLMILGRQGHGSRVPAGALGLGGGGINGFAETRGTHFEVNGRPLYLNGFNAYWLMYMASDPSTRSKVTTTFEQASKYGMNVCRTWAFSDGVSYRPLQKTPGLYNEEMFKGLDFVVSEAKKQGVYLILSLVNNWDDYGGKKQYVQWARDQGHYLNNEDDFFTNPITREFFKNHIKAVLTRVNSFTGIAYKDDPTIFAWELMNEPPEMAAYVKSVDSRHLVEVGLEGFYGNSMPEKTQHNPGYQVGTDFISNNQLKDVDFATIHLYPDQWKPGADDAGRDQFVKEWVEAHIEDSKSVLGKPLVLSEFGKSSRTSGYTVAMRDSYFEGLYDTIYTCARNGGACGGGIFWQVMAQGMEGWADGYEVVLDQSPSTVGVISQQSHRLSSLT